MDFVFNLFVLIISLSLVQSRETIEVSKSFKINEKMIYDCVDIYQQPSLKHPLLKNHKIEMEPSFSIPKSKNQVESKMHEKIIDCPNGMVPILRNTKEYAANAQYFTEKHFNPLTGESHGAHFAGTRLERQSQDPMYGMASWISVHDLNISEDQVSYAHIYVGSKINNINNFIQAGWMINQKLFGDGHTWSYGFWKGANGSGCYNSVCPGFVQVSKTDPLCGPLPQLPSGKTNIGISLQQSKKSGNWWITDVVYKKPDIGIGYWPKELFDQIGNGVTVIGVGGAAISSSSGVSPPMGNGHLPTENDMDSARVRDILVMESNHKFYFADRSKLEKVLDSEKCYGATRGKEYLLIFGGPGGNSC